ncbi:hypothetical protein P0D72_29110 [Paraburkholderia sediminicola]|uniref:hypothetical protein n=1 Tax=Paraburkholderia TaxID=1822464 RepID=UPI0038BC3FCA
MSNFLMLLLAAAGSSSLCACSANVPLTKPAARPAIVIRQPKGEQGDFVLCNDGRVLVFAVSHPETCS